MKKLSFKLLSWWNKRRTRNGKAAWFMDWMHRFRLVEALTSGGVKIAALGDSRIHGGEPAFEAEPGWRCFGVSGAKSDPDGENWGAILANACGAEAALIDWAGNDFLQNAEVRDVLASHLKTRAAMQRVCKNVLSYEICPLGLPAENPINQKIARFNAALAVAIGPDFVPLNDLLSPGGSMLQKYNSGDDIHWSPAAYEEVVIPRTRAALRARGLA